MLSGRQIELAVVELRHRVVIVNDVLRRRVMIVAMRVAVAMRDSRTVARHFVFVAMDAVCMFRLDRVA